MKRMPIEQETIILFNESEATAEVSTCNRKLLSKLKTLEEKYPGQVVCTGEELYTVPKACVMVREPYSEQRRMAARERALAMGNVPPRRKK
jgi:hypothetical protein